MEPQNVYETLYQNAVLDTDEVDCLPKRGGWTNDSTGYTNSGFDDHSYELPLSDFTVYSHVSSMPDTQNRGRLRENALYQGLSEEEVLDAQNANIRNGIRQFAMATTKENKKEPERSSKNSYNCCLMLCVIILLLASLTSSAYVFYRYHTQKDGECSSKIQGASHPHSADDTTKDEELRQISDELEKLDNEIQHIKSNPVKTSDTREDRRRFRQLSLEAKKVEKELNNMEEKLNNQVQNVNKDFNSSIVQLDTKINSFRDQMKKCEVQVKLANGTFLAQLLNLSDQIKSERQNRSLGKCAFKKQDITSNKRGNQTVKVVERKSRGTSIFAATCCSEYSKHFERAFLTVEEKDNTTYTCHCFNGSKCGICYWECPNK